MKYSKNGFTLVELLAVIVVLSIILLMASSGVGGALEKARMSSLSIEGTELINSAKNQYQLDVLDRTVKTQAACYPIRDLFNLNLFSKGNGSDDYVGSVLITNNNGKVTYKFWIGNGTYCYINQDSGAKVSDAKSYGAGQCDTTSLNLCGSSSKQANIYYPTT